jgi:ferredoxin
MSHKISDACTSCGACVDLCPVDAISQGESKYLIDPKKCTDCGACVDACPVEAISPEAAS